jgi:hypothetical protein
MISDDDMLALYNKYLQFTDDQLTNHDAMAVAGIMLAQALSIYKTAMNDEDYNNMIDTISDSRHKVKSFNDDQVLQ